MSRNTYQPKSLFFSRPTLGHYISTKKELVEATDKLIRTIKVWKSKNRNLQKIQARRSNTSSQRFGI